MVPPLEMVRTRHHAEGAPHQGALRVLVALITKTARYSGPRLSEGGLVVSHVHRSLSRGGALRLGAGAAASLAFGRLPAFAAAPAGPSVKPAEALARLMAGNKRFVKGTLTNQDGIVERRLALTGHQAPFVTILSCSDSRVPPELVFDQTVGDLFIFRNAGNFVTDAVLGTLEYGYGALGVKLIVVLGHEQCGAVSATYDAIKDDKPLPPNLNIVQGAIAPGIANVVDEHGSKQAAVLANARAQAAKMKSSPVLGPAIASGDCKVVAAEYHFRTGEVNLVL
jgi:carbonic anhydrase